MSPIPSEQPKPPRALVVVAGRIASGKSTLAHALAARLDAARCEADRVRGTLLEAAENEAAGSEARWRRDFSAGFEAEIYTDLLRRADETLASGRALVVDACFPLRAQRGAARALAARHGVRFLFVECRIPETTLRARLAERDRAAGLPVWEALHRRLADHFESLDDLSPREHVAIDCEGATDPLVDVIVERLCDAVPTPSSDAPALARLPLAVSFDCWSTLLAEEDWPWAHSLRVMALQDAAREAGLEVSRERAEEAFRAAWGRHMTLWEEGEVSGSAEVAEWGLAELGLPDTHPAFEHLVRRYEEASHTSNVVALDGARELLAALVADGRPSVLVCDTGLTPGRVVRRLLDRAGLLEHLRVLAFSDEVGAPKPDPRPFRAAIEPLGIEPDQVLHVGDLRRTDVAGARALGMQTVRIRARHDDVSDAPDADRVVGSHMELARLLGLKIRGG